MSPSLRDECQTCRYFEPKAASRPLGYCHRNPEDPVAQRGDYGCTAFERKGEDRSRQPETCGR